MFRNRLLGMGLLIAVLAFLSAYPLGMLVYGSLRSAPIGIAGDFNLNGYRAIFTIDNIQVLIDTLSIAVAKTSIAATLAVILAWIVARTDTPMRRVIEVMITLPFFIPPFLTAMAWAMLAGPEIGILNVALRGVFGSNAPQFNVYSWGGVVWHMIQYSTPFLFLFVVEAFRNMDPALEDASRMCGASRWVTLRRIVLVLMLPVITNAFILSFIRSIEAFDSPLIFGHQAGIRVMTTEIYYAINHLTNPNYQYATAVAIFALGVMFVFILIQWKILGNRSFTTITGKGYSPSIIELGPWKWVSFGFVVTFILITVILPIGQLAIGSFSKHVGFYSWDLTLEHYKAVWNNRVLWRGLRNTGLLGLAGATVTMILGALVAYVIVRTRAPGRRLVEGLAWLPWMMPGMVLGLGFLWAFAILPHAVPIYGTLWALLIAYVTLATPLSVRIISSMFAQLSFDLEECSRVHGATWLQTVRRIVVALVWPSLVVGWMIVFFLILRELSASVLLYAAGTEVLSIVLLSLWQQAKPEQVCVVGLLLMTLVLVFRWLQELMAKRTHHVIGN
jgi:iron(III) transport system permease protein